MDINVLFKTGILAYTIVSCINNNTNAFNSYNIRSTYHNVNSAVFQHDVYIYNDDERHEIEYAYMTPKRKIYVMDSNTGFFEEVHNRYSTGTKYIAYTDSKDEYNYKKYNCEVQYTNTSNRTDSVYVSNKFNELYKLKITNGIFGDVKTSFSNAVCKVFGSDYTVINDNSVDFSKFFAQHQENIIQATMEDGTQKNLIKLLNVSDYDYLDKIDKLLKQSSFQLTTQFKKYSWYKEEGIIVKNDKGEEKQINMGYYGFLEYLFLIRNIIIANGCNVMVFNPFREIINIYKKNKCHTKLGSCKDLVDKFNKIGLAMQEAYEAELSIVQEVFGDNFENLIYSNH